MTYHGKYILALDQGTSSSRAILIDEQGKLCASSQKDLEQLFPQPGWVEHDATEIWKTQEQVMLDVIQKAEISPEQIECIGITNQRESTVMWNRVSGEPLYHVIVWQDKRTADACDRMVKAGKAELVKSKTGLIIDAYFSASKMAWLMEHAEEAAPLLEKGDLLVGTVDSWIIWNLTNGKSHVTDETNASRTMLYNIHDRRWDTELLELWKLSEAMLPEVKRSMDDFGRAEIEGISIPITGVAGDQQAALFGQACFDPGMVKNTYGTGCFMLMNTGESPSESTHGLISTIAYSDKDSITYALEGSVFIAGAAVQWLRDGLKIIDSAPDSEYFASKAGQDGVYVVPAFSGLGAPYWDMYARGAIFGLSRDSGKPEIIRATLESMAYQTKDVLDVMQEDAGLEIPLLKVDGGASENDLLMQFQADIIGTKVERPKEIESTAMGAAFLAGVSANLWNMQEVRQLREIEHVFTPEMDSAHAEELYKGWRKAVKRTMAWITHE